jgi:hypothetical protein
MNKHVDAQLYKESKNFNFFNLKTNKAKKVLC